jgi:hypothetical protein
MRHSLFVEPRSLTQRETEILAFLLTAEFPGAEKLRQQAATAQVVGRCDCGCATVYLAVDPSLPVANEVTQSHAVEAVGETPGEDKPPREVIMFVSDGRLSSIEIVWYGDAPIAEFPPADEFKSPAASWAARS